MSRLVWYAAYGSNLSRSRFGFYLRGGVPEGSTHAFPGSRDQTDPLDDRPWEIPRELAFGGRSRTWGGGVAFIDCDAEIVSRARLYLITADQLADVIAQENWLAPGSVRVPDLETGGEFVVGVEHVYGLVLGLGSLESYPVVTFTQHRGTACCAPSPAYLRHIAAGLRESHGMSDEEIVDYLGSRRGVAGALASEAVLTAITSARP